MSNDKKYTFIIKDNGTLIHLLEDGPVPPTVPGAFLALHFALGLCLNVILIFTVLTCRILRRISFNLILLQLCIVCALDCFLNITSAVAFIFVTHLEGWEKYKQEMALACRVNAALTQWTTAIQSVALTALAMDRAIMLQHQDDPKNELRNRLMKTLPTVMWVYGTALVTPIVATSHIVGVRPFPDRYSCGVISTSENAEDLLYPCLLLILGYILPWIITAVLFTVIILHVISTRRRLYQLEEAALQRSQGRTALANLGNSSMLHRSSSSQTSWSNWLGNAGPLDWEEVKFYFLALWILIFYIVLLIPHILCVNIPTLTPRPQEASLNSNISTVPPELKMIETGDYDCIFVWCRYSFTILVPIVIFLIHKEVRKKCERLFCCCFYRNNAVIHMDTARSISATIEKRTQLSAADVIRTKNENSKKKYRTKKDKYRRIAHYKTPVIFATSEGLHLRLVDDQLTDSYYFNETDTGGHAAAGSKEKSWTVEPQFLCEFADVALVLTTPTDAGLNLQQSYGASTSITRGSKSKPHVFTEDTIAEGDLHVSDETADSSGEFASKFAKSQSEKQDNFVFNNNEINRKISINNNRKIPRVRFSQTVSEIPLTESGVWSATEEQTIVEQGFYNKNMEYQDTPSNSLNTKPKTNAVNVPARSRVSS